MLKSEYGWLQQLSIVTAVLYLSTYQMAVMDASTVISIIFSTFIAGMPSQSRSIQENRGNRITPCRTSPFRSPAPVIALLHETRMLIAVAVAMVKAITPSSGVCRWAIVRRLSTWRAKAC